MLDKAQQAQGAEGQVRRAQHHRSRRKRRSARTSARRCAQRFGVVQDPAVTQVRDARRHAAARSRPSGRGCAWTFIVLDTDGVNAFASPGGFVHITRGALGLIKNEAELAAVLAHEIGHVAHKHTVNAIRKNKAVQMGTNATLSDRGPFLDKIANKAYEMVLENSFDRGDELDADKVSVTLTPEARLRARARSPIS